MARETRTHLPEDEYLLAIGQLAYMITSVEGLLIFDLPGFSAYLPAGATPADFANKTTGGIGRALNSTADEIADARSVPMSVREGRP
jgi:hypothetical protein